MIVLNIDLDFFLDNIPYGSGRDKGRKPSEEFKVWEEAKVIEFIEKNFSLRIDKKIRGRIIEHHEEAFYYLRELIINGELEIPFKLLHVDAHFDMGYFPDGSWKYIVEVYLKKPYLEKIYPENQRDYGKYAHFGCGNYLLYILANGWLSSIDYFYHPKLEEFDFPPMFTKIVDRTNKIFKVGLGIVDGVRVTEKNIYDTIEEIKYESYVKTIGYKEENMYSNIDYVIVSKSPQFTPVESDKLLDVFSRYILF